MKKKGNTDNLEVVLPHYWDGGCHYSQMIDNWSSSSLNVRTIIVRPFQIYEKRINSNKRRTRDKSAAVPILLKSKDVNSDSLKGKL